MLADCHIFRVSSSERESPSGRKGTFFLLDAPDWAGVIPVVETAIGRSFVMIRQFRHGTDHVSVEFPGGAIEKGEDPVLAVGRELVEETGYKPGMIIPLGSLSPNPAFMTNSFHAFIAEGCELVRPQALDEQEEIEVILVPEREAIDLVGGEDYGHALMTATLFLYMRYRGLSA
jgi:ADP-ribose pyrophosphatase